ncbi:MAG: hypothetical protein C5B51_23280 [Terriglobia bacterium]|nr:MAG: hypothetical protein C5B51_23280 [Terriglobia bacterium]
MRQPALSASLILLCLSTLPGCRKATILPATGGIPLEAARAGGPPAPVNLTATAESRRVRLSWMPGSAGSKEFRIYRFTGPNPAGVSLAGVARPTGNAPFRFDDDTALPGMTYTYFVTAVDAFGQQGGYSNLVTVTATK